MSKKTAHIVLCIFDIAVIYVVWWGGHKIGQVVTDVKQSADVISFLDRIGFFVPGIILPLGHGFVIFEHFYPAWVQRRTGLLNVSVILALAVLIVSAFFISSRLQNHVRSAGYHYCEQAGNRLTFSKVLVFTRDAQICRRLVEEKRSE